MPKPTTPQKTGSTSSGSARLRTAAVVLPVLIASILFPWLKWLFVAMAIAAMALALFEFYVLAKQQQLKPDTGAGFLAAIAILVDFAFPRQISTTSLLVQLVIIVLTAGTFVADDASWCAVRQDARVQLARPILGVLYIALLGSHLVAMRMWFTTRAVAADMLSFFFLVLMGADAGAYYVGRAFGKRKLAPSISPGNRGKVLWAELPRRF